MRKLKLGEKAIPKNGLWLGVFENKDDANDFKKQFVYKYMHGVNGRTLTFEELYEHEKQTYPDLKINKNQLTRWIRVYGGVPKSLSNNTDTKQLWLRIPTYIYKGLQAFKQYSVAELFTFGAYLILGIPVDSMMIVFFDSFKTLIFKEETNRVFVVHSSEFSKDELVFVKATLNAAEEIRKSGGSPIKFLRNHYLRTGKFVFGGEYL